MATYVFAREFARPVPAHTLTDSARDAVMAVQRYAATRRLDRAVAGIVLDVGRPPGSAAWEGDPVARNARGLLALAQEHGFTARLSVVGESCMVEGHHPARVGFRCYWRRGRILGGSWHEPWRYELVDDPRTVAIDQRARVGKAGHRSPGMGTTRLSIVASPRGVPIGYAALKARLIGYDA